MVHHMLDRKKSNTIIPYSESISNFLKYNGFDLDEEELDIIHSNIGKSILS